MKIYSSHLLVGIDKCNSYNDEYEDHFCHVVSDDINDSTGVCKEIFFYIYFFMKFAKNSNIAFSNLGGPLL